MSSTRIIMGFHTDFSYYNRPLIYSFSFGKAIKSLFFIYVVVQRYFALFITLSMSDESLFSSDKM